MSRKNRGGPSVTKIALGTLVVAALVAISIRLCIPLTGSEAPAAASGPEGTIVVFHAGSLTWPMTQLAKAYRVRHPRARIQLEAAGSRHCARKIADLGRRADVMASADYKVIDTLLIPKHASYNIRFAVGEMVIAYGKRLRGRIRPDNWYQVLEDPKVRIGRSDPNSDPCGYRSVMVFQLAEAHYGAPGLAGRLTRKHGHRFIRPKETDLLALLEAGEIDALPIYRSVAVQHHLGFVTLPPEVNLADPTKATLYRRAQVDVTGRTPGSRLTRHGEPIVYSVTVPRGAPNPRGGVALVAFLLGPEGRRILRASGQPPIIPPLTSGPAPLPTLLAKLVRVAPSHPAPNRPAPRSPSPRRPSP